jgi:hypothetical protein
MALMLVTVAMSVFIAIKYDEYENRNMYRIRHKPSRLVLDPVDGEWEFLRKVRFDYIETTVEKYEERSTQNFGMYPYGGIDLQRCA